MSKKKSYADLKGETIKIGKKEIYNGRDSYSQVKENLAQKKINYNVLTQYMKDDIGVDTLASDLEALNKDINQTYSSWQKPGWVRAVRGSIGSMDKRLDALKNLATITGNKELVNEIGNTRTSYFQASDNLRKVGEAYGNFENAEHYGLAKMSSKDIEPYLKGDSKIAYTTKDGQNLTWQTLYDQKKSAEDADALYKKVTADKDFGKYVDKGKNVKNPDYNDVYNLFGSASEEDIINEVEFALNNKEAFITDYDSNSSPAAKYNAHYFITDKERAIYNYYLGQELEGKVEKGTAKKYFDSIYEILKARFENKVLEGYISLAENLPVIASALSVPLNVLSGVETIADGINYFKTGELDTNTTAQGVSSMRGIVANQYDWDIAGWDAFDFAYNTGMSMADSAVSNAVFGKAGGVVLGLSAAGSAMNDAKARGMDDDQAFWTGVEAGVAEGLFETISLGMTKSFKGVPVDSTRTAFKNVAKTIFVNAEEEFATELANQAYDRYVNGEFSQYETQIRAYVQQGMSEDVATYKVMWERLGQLGEAALSGAVMGGIWGGLNARTAYNGSRAIGENVADNNRAKEVFDMASHPEMKNAYDAYTAYAKKGINAENASDAQVGALWQRTKNDLESTFDSRKSTGEQRLKASQTYYAIDEYIRPNVDSKIKRSIGSTIVEKGLKTGKDTESYKIASELKDKLKKGEALTEEEVEKLANAINKSLVSERLTELGEGENTSEIADIIARKISGEVISPDELKAVKKSKYGTQVLSESNEVLMQHASAMDKESGDLFVRLYDGEANVEAYANAFNLMREYAYNSESISQDEALANKGVLSGEQASEIYKSAILQQSADAKANAELMAKARKGARGIINESAINYGKEYMPGKVNWNSLKSTQQQSVVFLKGLYKALGSNITFVNRSKKFNGAYDVTKDMTYVDVYAGINLATNQGKEMVLLTASHELTHEMEVKSPELFKMLSNIVLNSWAESTGLSKNDIIANEIAKLDEKHPEEGKHTEKDAISEIVARACEGMLLESAEAKKMFNSLSDSEKKTLGEHIKDVIQKIVDWIDNLLGKYDVTSEEAKALKEMKEAYTAMSMLWDKMLLDVQKVNRSLTESATKESATEDVKLSEREIIGISGKSYGIGVYLDSNLLTGLTEDERKQMVKEYVVSELAGEHFIAYNNNVAVDIGLATKNARIKNPKGRSKKVLSELYRKNIDNSIKQEVVVLADELIANAKYDTTKSSDYSHDWLDNYGKNDWDYWKVFIQEKNKSVWEATLNIANTANGEKILYDIDPIKMVEQAVKSATSTTNNSIHNSNGNVNTKFSDTDSIGKKLSEGQIDYFKDSKVRDENGNLKVMYRGDKENFTVFDKKKTSHSNLYGRGFYFTDSKAHAEQYGDAREFYLDIKNPLSPNQNAITKEQMLNFLKAIENDGEDYDLYNYGQGATAESVLNSVWGKGDFEMLQDISASAIGDLVAAVELFNEVNGTSYDGIVLPTETVTFESEQAKLTSNLNPTKNKDMRFADRDTEYLELAKNPEQNEARLREMVEEAAKEAGYTIKAFHSTDADFTVFDIDKTSEFNYHGKGIYFSNSQRDVENNYEVYNGPDPWVKIEERAYELLEEKYGLSYEDTLTSDSEIIEKVNETFKQVIDEFQKNVRRINAYLKFERPLVLEKGESGSEKYNLQEYDGIIDKQVYEKINHVGMDEDTIHYVVFNPRNIKSSELVTYDDDGNIIPLSERFNTEKDDIRYSERDYSYEKLISKPDMELTVLDGNVPNNRADIINEAKKKAAKIGKVNVKEKTVLVFVDDIERDILLGTDGLKHSLNRGKNLQNQPIGIVTLNAGEIIKNSIRINELTPSKESATGSYVLIGAAKDTDNMYIVRFIVNEYNNKLASMDVLYAINTKKEPDVLNAPRYANDSLSVTDSTISIAELLDYVNKYFPDILPESVLRHYDYDARPEGELGKDALFSDRTDTTVYDLMGERDALLERNKRLEASVKRLGERLSLDKKVTNGTVFREDQVKAVARYLVKTFDSKADVNVLTQKLMDNYRYIAQIHKDNPSGMPWQEVFAGCYNIAYDIASELKPRIEIDDYSASILKEIRKTRISLNEAQKTEAQNRFGKNWNRRFMGRVIIANDGLSLDKQWQEWASEYPGTFSKDTNTMDMLQELGNIVDSLQEARETIVEYNTNELTMEIAEEIYNKFWTITPIQTTADKYVKQIKMLNHEHRKEMEKAKAEYESNRVTDKNKSLRLAKELRDRKNRDVARAKELGKQRLDSFKENAEKKTVIQSITSISLGLNDTLEKNSKDKHVPEVLKDSLRELLAAINFSSKRMLEGGLPTKNDIRIAEAFKNLRVSVLESETSVEESLIELYGSNIAKETADLAKQIDEISKNLNGKQFILNQISLDNLKTLNNMLKIFRKAINNINKFHTSQRGLSIEEAAIKTTKELKAREKIYNDNEKHFDKLKTKLYWNNLTPYYAYKNMGDTALQRFRAIMDGQDKMAFLSKEVIDFAGKQYTAKEYKAWSEQFFEFKVMQPSGKEAKFLLNVPQIMSLYCITKQEDGKRHVLHGTNGKGGGITIVETKKTRGTTDNIQLSSADLKNILSVLDSKAVGRAKEVADGLQKYMNERGAELGNEVSMARWGIKSFGDIENYFPIKASKGTYNKGEVPGVNHMSLLAILNRSFTHSRNKYADKSVEIGDVFDVFSEHMSEMIQYNAMALPVLDMYKWLNSNGTDENGSEYAVETSIVNTFGDNAIKYIVKFMQDLNGTTKDQTMDNMGVKFFKNAKVAKVALNLRVAGLQYTAYLRAGAVIDNKYLLKALAYKPKIKKAEENCGIALWKSLGYYDTDITKGLTDLIKHDTNWKDTVTEWSLKGAEWGDKLTWGVLWNACELELRETRKDLTPGTKEFDRAVGLRLREVVYRTQVVDSVATKSQMMRGSAWDKMLTSFASENAISFNLASDIFVTTKLDARSMGTKASLKKNGKYMRKAIAAYIATNLVSALIQTAFDAFRNYDEEEDEWAILKMFLANMASNSSIINKLPYFNQITSFLSGFSSSRMETDWMEKTVTGVKQLYKWMFEDGSGEKAFKTLLDAASNATGIGLFNLYRDATALYNLFFD